MRNFTTLFLFGLILIPASLFAQQKLTPAWSARFSTTISWQRVHSLGYIIVSTNEGLYGVNPADGTIAWENKTFTALDPSMMEEVSGTEFLAITYKVDKSSTIPLQAIIKVIDGKVLFDSKKE